MECGILEFWEGTVENHNISTTTQYKRYIRYFLRKFSTTNMQPRLYRVETTSVKAAWCFFGEEMILSRRCVGIHHKHTADLPFERYRRQRLEVVVWGAFKKSCFAPLTVPINSIIFNLVVYRHLSSSIGWLSSSSSSTQDISATTQNHNECTWTNPSSAWWWK